MAPRVLTEALNLRSLLFPLVALALLASGCGSNSSPSAPTGAASQTLAEARRGFKTRLTRQDRDGEPVAAPPKALFRLVKYPSPAGELSAYVGVPKAKGKKSPAILWIFGGFSNGIGDTAWAPATADNDQSARAFREAGFVMMYPSRRGGNDNPGFKEGFYGEVDDVLAAADYLAKQDYVDANRIYLGGHSTGGTVALLAAEVSPRFRAVFSFGPIADVRGYGEENLPFDLGNIQEATLRAPLAWLHGLRTPTFVFEGGSGSSNIASVQELARASRNPQLHCYEVPDADHFSILAQLTPIVAGKALADTGPTGNIVFNEEGIRPLGP